MDIDVVLEALADPVRRDLFERIVVRPTRLSQLAGDVTVSQPSVSHHVRILKEAGLIHLSGDRLTASFDVLPTLRAYFDRLWLEASLGDAWLIERRETLSDFGL